MINSVTSGSSIGFSMVGRGRGSSVTINNFPPHTPTAGLSPYTDAEIKERLRDLARREVAAGNYAWSETSAAGNCSAPNREEFRRLMTYFQSNVAPERVGAVNSQISSMSSGLSLSAMQNTQNANIFEIIMRHLGQSGRNPNVGVDFIHFTDGNPSGLPIAMYMQGGGLTATFREEDGDLQRAGEFNLMFKDMKTQIKSEEGNTDSLINLKREGHNVDLSLWSNPNTAFNMERLAANGITFNAETGQTNVDHAKLKQAANQYASNSLSR